MKKWDYIYDEEVADEKPNFVGVISNGNSLLFYHAYTTDIDGKEEEIEELYSSLQELISGGERVISFKWTSENEERLINFLNSLPENADVFSDSSELLNFKPEEME